MRAAYIKEKELKAVVARDQLWADDIMFHTAVFRPFLEPVRNGCGLIPDLIGVWSQGGVSFH
jgi:hypothetical protein